jgi:activator of HSP90 ATPase
MEEFKIKSVIPAEPAAVYRAWLSGAQHGAMTGARATASAKEGGSFTAWDGYISGKNTELKKDSVIQQAWRTTEFPKGAPDSLLEITLKKARGGTEIALNHSGIPDGQGKTLKKGWQDFYFTPMRKYFGKTG